jgi:hypothetical protein
MKIKRISLGDLASPYDYQAESDLNTLIEAEKIEADPKRLAKAQALAKTKLSALAKTAGSSASELAALAEAA